MKYRTCFVIVEGGSQLLHLQDNLTKGLGSVLAGGLAQAFGAPSAFLVGGAVATLLVVVAAVRFRSVREL